MRLLNPWRGRRELAVAAATIGALLGPLLPARAATPAPATFSPYGSQVVTFDVNGDAVDAHDGEVLAFNGTYYLYGTSYGCGYQAGLTGAFCGFKVYASPDMTHWTDRGFLFDATTATWQERCAGGVTRGCYRPHVAFNAATSTYVLWINSYDVSAGYHVLTSGTPVGPFVEAAIPTLAINSDAPAGGNGDQDLFVDDDGTGYIAYTDWNRGGDIVVERLNPSFTGGTGVFARLGITQVEAPMLFRRGATYYLAFSDPNCIYCGGTGTSYLTAATPLGPWRGATAPTLSAWTVTGGRLLARGGGVGLSAAGSAWTDYTFSADVTPGAVPSLGYAQAGWVVRSPRAGAGYLYLLGNYDFPGTGHAFSAGSLTRYILRGGTPTSGHTMRVPMPVVAGQAHHVETIALGSSLTTSIDGVEVDRFLDSTYSGGRVGFREFAPVGENATIANASVVAADGTSLLRDYFADLAQWDPPVDSPTSLALSPNSCGGQPAHISTIPTAQGPALMYQVDLWNAGQPNQGLANYYFGTLGFGGDGAPLTPDCTARFAAPVVVGAAGAADNPPRNLDQQSGTALFRPVCDINQASWRRQVFTVSRAGVLEQVEVEAFQQRSPDAALVLDLVALDGNASTPAGVVVSQSFAPSGVSSAPTRLRLAPQVAVVAGARFAVVLHSFARHGCYGVVVNDNQPYRSGEADRSYDGFAWTVEPGRAVKFDTSVSGTPAGGGVNTVAPVRVLDTRAAPGGAHPIGPGETLVVPVAVSAGLPRAAVAVVMNVTATNATERGYLTVFPSGAPRPAVSSVNFSPGAAIPNLVQVPLGPDGSVAVYNDAGRTDAVLDVVGWTSGPAQGGGLYEALPPTRVIDTRAGAGGARLGPGATLDVSVGAPFDMGGAASAVLLNVTAVAPSSSGFLTVYPAGTPRPVTSNVNFVAGHAASNRVLAAVSPSGHLVVYNSTGSTDVVIDISGRVGPPAMPTPGGAFSPVFPARLLDTRDEFGGVLRPGAQRVVNVAGRGGVPPISAAIPARAVILNVTVIDPTEPGYLTAYPAGGALPGVSDINFATGQVVANQVVVALGPAGDVMLYNFGGFSNVAVDVAGWYA